VEMCGWKMRQPKTTEIGEQKNVAKQSYNENKLKIKQALGVVVLHRQAASEIVSIKRSRNNVRLKGSVR